MEEIRMKNPWLGLESYKEGEILYGRDDDIRDLSQCVLNDTDTLLYGKSGIGKSSILNAGIIPAARRHGFLPVLIRFSHKEKRAYLCQIKDAIANAMIPIPLDGSGNQISLSVEELRQRNAELERRIVKVVDCKDGNKESLYEFFHRHTFHDVDGERIKLLIIFDQFEEIFTLQADEPSKKQFFSELADFLNDVMPTELLQEVTQATEPQNTKTIIGAGNFGDLFNELKLGAENNLPEYITDNEIHLVFTIREDFLSEFEYYSSAIPSLKQNRYGLRPINEEQAAQIIMRPIPGLIDKSVAKLIIEKVTGRTDFELDGIPEIEVDSAVLSLYLNRLYDSKTGSQITSALVEDKGGEIIANFYNDAISGISEPVVEYLEDVLLNGQGRRDNITIFDAVNEGGVTETELDILCNKKKILRQFNYAGDLRIEYVHDILCPVVKEHKDERILLKQQEEERQRQEEEKIKIQAEAKKKQHEIEEKAAREKAELEKAALKTKRRNKRIYTLSATALLAVMLGVTYYYFANIYTYKSYYKDFSRQNGWPVGIGKELGEKERGISPLYYCLSHKGSKSPILRLLGIGRDKDLITDVEILSSNSRLPHKPRISSFEVADIETTDAKALVYNELLSNIQKIHFVGGESDKIEKEVALNDEDSTLFVITYFHLNSSDMWATFLTSQGQSMQIREKEGIDRMKISTDSIGRVRSLMYYDQNGVCQPINDGVCGYSWVYDTDGNSERRYLLNQFSLPIDRKYNLVISQNTNDSISTRYRHVSSVDDGIGEEALGPEGFCKLISYNNKVYMYVSESDQNFSTKTITKDKSGNIISEEIENNLSKKSPSLVNYLYNKDGELLKMEKLTSGHTPFAINDKDNYLYEWEYVNGKKVKEIRRNKNGITFLHTIETQHNVTKETVENIYANEYIVKVDSIFNDSYSTSYYGRDNLPINHKVKLEEDSISFHRKHCVKQGDKELRYFYVYDGIEKKAPLATDKYGKPLSYYCKEIQRDKNGNIISYKKLDENGKTIKSMMFFTLNGQVVGRAAQGIDGKPVRCNKWEEEGFLYYQIYYNKDFDDHFVGIQGMNEWGQKSVFNDPAPSGGYQIVEYKDFMGSVIVNGSEILHSYKHSSPGEILNLIVNGPEILRSYKQYVLGEDKNVTDFSYPYLHILDNKSCLYNANFKDGDRIVKFGKWAIGNSFKLLDSEWTAWNGSGNSVSIEVLRTTIDGSVERVRKEVECSSLSKDLQEYHLLALSNSEFDYLTKNNILK